MATNAVGTDYQNRANPQAVVNRQIARLEDVSNPEDFLPEWKLRPDIVDHQNRTIYELKPEGIFETQGRAQIANYISVLHRKDGVTYRGGEVSDYDPSL